MRIPLPQLPRLAPVATGVAAAAILLTAGSARAQDAQGPKVSGSLTVASDYLVRGVSQTKEGAAVLATVDVVSGGLYAGAFAGNVAFPGDPGTRVEVDVYAGVRHAVGGFDIDVGVVAYLYDDPDGFDYDFVELKAAVSRAFGPVSIGAVVLHSPDFLGATEDEATYVEGQVALSAGERWTVSTAFGTQVLSSDLDYSNWNVGAAYAFTDRLALGLRYHATDALALGEIYEDRLVASLRTAF
ncbi:TorF family putative porin [Brevundimonas sp.]|uniref:TorF family putative porin n=1 Tax=Brevundimonas sp. TaxID=1871086 RepID=UPI003569E30B